MSALLARPREGKANVTVGQVPGGYAFWCATCQVGQAAQTGIGPLDADVINRLADMHESDHRKDNA